MESPFQENLFIMIAMFVTRKEIFGKLRETFSFLFQVLKVLNVFILQEKERLNTTLRTI